MDAAPAPRSVLHRVLATVRTIIGAPDYDLYVAHVQDRHPECTPLTRDEFARERLSARYDRPGSRCC